MPTKIICENEADWLNLRYSGLGGTDISAIIGVNPWKTSIDVLQDKKSRINNFQETIPVFLGKRLESAVLELYNRETNQNYEKNDNLFCHDSFKIAIGTPDALKKNCKKGLEIKTSWRPNFDEWGESGTDQIPEHYKVQCQWYMAIMDYDEWDLAALLAGTDFRIYNIKRDKSFENVLLNTGNDWWNQYIIEGKEPPIDGSNNYLKYLNFKFKENVEPLKIATPEIEDKIIKLLQIKEETDVLEDNKSLIENELKFFIGDAEGVKSQYATITWKKPKDTVSIDYETLSKSLLSEEVVESQKEKYTKIRENTRRFLVKPARGVKIENNKNPS
jgi:putative phage-type endonuclease